MLMIRMIGIMLMTMVIILVIMRTKFCKIHVDSKVNFS